MARRERDILEDAVRRINEQAANTNRVIDHAMEAGPTADHPVTLAAKQIRLEPLRVKADLERELATWVLDCKAAVWTWTGFRASAWLTLGIGGTASPRPAASQWCSEKPRAVLQVPMLGVRL